MSLFRKLVFSISAMVLLLLAGNLVVTIHNARSYFAEQSQALADDTATYLGLSISQAVKRGDDVQVQTMISAIFDRGYYRSIVYYDLEGKTVISRTRELTFEGVPSWFVEYVNIPQRSGRAEVIAGWYQLGKIYVDIHPGYAYSDLWRMFNQSVWLFLFTMVLCYALAGIALKMLLRPLQKIEDQAEAICRSEFPLQNRLPKTPELRRMVVAMNRMVQKLQAIFQEQIDLTESLRVEAFIDPITGLPNRKEFDSRLTTWVKSEDGGSPGVLVLLHVSGINDLNDSQGRDAGDKVLADIGSLIVSLLDAWPDGFVARRSGCDFSIFVPAMLQEEAGAWLSEMKMSMDSLDTVSGLTNMKFWLGAATSKSVNSISNMLSAADAALRLAKSSGDSDWAVYPVDDPLADIRPAGEWQQYLKRIIEKEELLLHFQPFYTCQQEYLGAELFSRAKDGDEIIQAGVFWPLAERFDLVSELDMLVLRGAIAALQVHSEQRLSVNISTSSLLKKGFIEWLFGYLRDNCGFTNRLTLELHEKTLALPGGCFAELYKGLQALGVSVALDHFGVTPSALAKLRTYPLAYVKVDRRFVSGIDVDIENRFYIQTLVQIAHGCDVKILADGVETAAEWSTLKGIGVDGGQGYFLARPDGQLSH